MKQVKRNRKEDNNKDKLLQQSHLSRPFCQPGKLENTTLLLRTRLPRGSRVWCCRSLEREAVQGVAEVPIRRRGEGGKGGIFWTLPGR